MPKKGFGVTKCAVCNAYLQDEPVYYQIICRTKSRFRCRRYKTIATLCEGCFKSKIHIP